MTKAESEQVTVSEMPEIDGLAVVASAGAKRQPMPVSQDPAIFDWIEENRWWSRLPPLRYQRYECGHRGVKTFTIRIWGTLIQLKPEARKARCPDCCLKELKRHGNQVLLVRVSYLTG